MEDNIPSSELLQLKPEHMIFHTFSVTGTVIPGGEGMKSYPDTDNSLVWCKTGIHNSKPYFHAWRGDAPDSQGYCEYCSHVSVIRNSICFSGF